MNDTNPYQALSLDEIIQITASDAKHAPQLREQGKGLKALADMLDESVESMLTARGVAETGFGGVAASQMHERATRLVARGSEGHAALRDQPDIFFGLSEQAELSHQRMLELRDERDRKLEKAAPGDRAGIREDYTYQAREYMRETTSGYVKALRRSGWMKGYSGPRLPRDGEANGPKGFVDRNTLGPTLGQAGIDSGPQLQGAATLVPETHHGASAGPPVLKGQSWVGVATVGITPKTTRSAKKKDKRRDRASGSGDKPVNRDVLPPVIGGRGEPEMAAAPDPVPNPRADGVVEPVIGTREGAQWADSREPLLRQDGLLPPVIGGRGMPMPGSPTSAIPAAPPASPPEPPRRRFAVTAAGVRSVRPDYPAEGKVFRGGPDAAAAATDRQTPAEPEFTREAKTVHGGPDNPDRSVIRNSRAFAEPAAAAAPAPEPVRDPHWRRTPEEPEFETGPFITNYNLGRSQ